MIRDWIKSRTANLFCTTGMDRVLRLRDLPVVVAYHRVVEDFASACVTSNPSMLVSRQMLEQHLDWIGQRYKLVSLDDLGERLECSDGSNEGLAAITFDDGYQDFYDHALPVLQKKGVPAALFVVTDYAGSGQVPLHDRLYLLLKRRQSKALPVLPRGVPNIRGRAPYDALRALIEALPVDTVDAVAAALGAEDDIPEEMLHPFRCLTWEGIGRVHRAGITIGSHTRSHALMTNETRVRRMDEAQGSRSVLERRLNTRIRHFAYPSGVFDPSAINSVAAAGYRFGYTTGSHRSAENPLLTIPRTVLWQKSSVDAHSAFSGAVLNCQIRHVFDSFTPGAYRQPNVLHEENSR